MIEIAQRHGGDSAVRPLPPGARAHGAPSARRAAVPHLQDGPGSGPPHREGGHRGDIDHPGGRQRFMQNFS
jgi:hypothetical protein